MLHRRTQSNPQPQRSSSTTRYRVHMSGRQPDIPSYLHGIPQSPKHFTSTTSNQHTTSSFLSSFVPCPFQFIVHSTSCLAALHCMSRLQEQMTNAQEFCWKKETGHSQDLHVDGKLISKSISMTQDQGVNTGFVRLARRKSTA